MSSTTKGAQRSHDNVTYDELLSQLLHVEDYLRSHSYIQFHIVIHSVSYWINLVRWVELNHISLHLKIW